MKPEKTLIVNHQWSMVSSQLSISIEMAYFNEQ